MRSSYEAVSSRVGMSLLSVRLVHKKPEGKEGWEASALETSLNVVDKSGGGPMSLLEFQTISCFFEHRSPSTYPRSELIARAYTMSTMLSLPLASGSRLRVRALVRSLNTSSAQRSHENPLVCHQKDRPDNELTNIGDPSSRSKSGAHHPEKRSSSVQIEDTGRTAYYHRCVW